MENTLMTLHAAVPDFALEQLNIQAQHLLERLSRDITSPETCGSFTPAVYDAAWLSMISKPVSGDRDWLFPQCFSYILSKQMDDGAWESYNSSIDGILNTAAALLAICHHMSPSQETQDHSITKKNLVELTERLNRGQKALQSLLFSWKVEETVHVGFEILVPSLLEQLRHQGVDFLFPGKEYLASIAAAKLERFDSRILYDSSRQITLLHSLEGLIGNVDFDKLKHHVSTSYGILGSPASTAAYLMNCSKWDESAEVYLCRVVKAYGFTGAVPSAFPVSIFEITWTLAMLRDAGLSLQMEPFDSVTKSIGKYVCDNFMRQGGLLGFSPGILADLDDTAKAISVLQALDQDPSPMAMIEAFEDESCFKTYARERNPSFSANCNALIALLGSRDPTSHEVQIKKIITFLLDTWDGGTVVDKWNLTPEYSNMVLSSALIATITRWSQGRLTILDDELLHMRLIAASVRLLVATLKRQQANGSWSDCVETSAYSLILLCRLSSLPFSTTVQQLIKLARQRGAAFLWSRRSSWARANYVWVEKVTYGSPLLSEAYCLAAMLSVPESVEWHPKLHVTFSALTKAPSAQILQLFARLPLFYDVSPALLELAQLEALCYKRRLQDMRLKLFPHRDANMTKDDYLLYIPLTWTSCNLLAKGVGLSGSIMWQMMCVSLANYQVDEIMETVMASTTLAASAEDIVRDVVHAVSTFEHSGEVGYPKEQEHKKDLRQTPKHLDVVECRQDDIQEHATGENLENVTNQDSEHVTNGNSRYAITGNSKHATNEDSGHAINGNSEHVMNGSNHADVWSHVAPYSESNSKTEPQVDDKDTASYSHDRHQAENMIRNFVSSILNSKPVIASSFYTRRRLAQELLSFLLAHCQHNNDNRLLRKSEIRNFNYENYSGSDSISSSFGSKTPPWFERSLRNWVQSVGAVDTSCPYSFSYFSCLIRGQVPGSDPHVPIFTTAEQSYLGEELTSSLANACRLFNDLGSWKRDKAEKNLNSLHFTEFDHDAVKTSLASNQINAGSPTTGTLAGEKAIKDELKRIGEFEMAKVHLTFERLKLIIPEPVHEALQTFIHVTELFGQIYVAKDIASRVKANADGESNN